jgi:hypothetical protein
MTDTLVDPLLELELEGAQLWAMWVIRPLGVVGVIGNPGVGWVHEGAPPWRVIVSRDPFKLPTIGGSIDRRPYTGSEPTVDVDEWIGT